MVDALLVLNAGSSSVKFAVYTLAATSADDPTLALRGQIAGIGTGPVFSACDAGGKSVDGAGLDVAHIRDHQQALDALLAWVEGHGEHFRFVAVGHRVVHGGRTHTRPQIVSADILDDLESLNALAPHHQPHNVAAMRAVSASAPHLPQVACYDTAFHARQPELARRLPLPRELTQHGLIRYGFHGLSYEYVVSALPPRNGGVLPQRLIIAHLGNGASACAVRDGISIATSMGFSTLDGLLMGTRCGHLDPGVLLYLMREHGQGEAELTDLLYNRSGLLGISGISSDMRELLNSDSICAKDAVEQFCYTLAREVGSLATTLEGLDGLVFTGGIGEHAAAVRAETCRRLRWLGVDLDDAANDKNGPCITRPESAVQAWVVTTNEELIIARHTTAMLNL